MCKICNGDADKVEDGLGCDVARVSWRISSCRRCGERFYRHLESAREFCLGCDPVKPLPGGLGHRHNEYLYLIGQQSSPVE